MVGGIPRAKIDDVTNRLQEMAQQIRLGNELNDLSWHRLLKDLKKLQSIQDYYAASLLNEAVLWSYRDSLGEISRLLNTYAAKFGKQWDWHLIRATMAPRFGSIDGVVDMINSGIPSSNKSVLFEVLEVLCQTGFFVSANKVLARIAELDSTVAISAVEGHYKFVPACAKYMVQNKMEETEAASRIASASRIVLDHGFQLRKYAVVSGEFGIMFELGVDASIDALVDMNFAISDKLAENFDMSSAEHISVGVYPWEDTLYAGSV